MMKRYITDKVLKITELNNYNEGIIGKHQSYFLDYRFEAETLEELYNDIKSFFSRHLIK